LWLLLRVVVCERVIKASMPPEQMPHEFATT
jgi:hypothetical protein